LTADSSASFLLQCAPEWRCLLHHLPCKSNFPERTFGEQNPLDRGRINGIGVKIPAAAIAGAWQMDVETQMIPALIESRNSAETSTVSFKSCIQEKKFARPESGALCVRVFLLFSPAAKSDAAQGRCDIGARQMSSKNV
jgi:hypothetical protein